MAEIDSRFVFAFRNLNPPSGGVDGSGTKQLHAEDTLDATADCIATAVEVPTQLAAHVAVPVGANTAVGAAVQELQKDSKLSRLAVNCLLKALAQLLPPQLGLSDQQ
jgi:hypothetical protein